MKTTAIKAWQVDLPLKEGRYSWSNGNFIEVFDSTVAAVETDEGLTGYVEGYTKFQLKVGADVNDDIERIQATRGA